MSRLIRVFVKPVLFRKLGDGPGPSYVPLFSDYTKSRKYIGVFPDGGELCYFLDFKAAYTPLLQGSAHSQRPENMDIWLKVIYQDMIGWIDMEHVQMIFELDPDDNGDMVEKQVYPYASDD